MTSINRKYSGEFQYERISKALKDFAQPYSRLVFFQKKNDNEMVSTSQTQQKRPTQIPTARPHTLP